jgi:fido (protein-threonine AMPylation protein)
VTDWDADGPKLRINLERVLDDIAQWAGQRRKISAATIKRWHRQAMAGLNVPDPNAIGRFRGEPGLEDEPVYIGSHKGTNAARVVAEVAAFVKRLHAVSGRLDRLLRSGEELDQDGLEAVIELAAWTHSEWVRIHPFCNGNGRTARMLANAILMRYGLPPVLRLRLRPPLPYGDAGLAGMERNAKPMETLLRRLLKNFPKQE